MGIYYAAMDNIKYGIPMEFIITMLAWGAVQYKDEVSPTRELDNVRDATRWGTNYFIK